MVEAKKRESKQRDGKQTTKPVADDPGGAAVGLGLPADDGDDVVNVGLVAVLDPHTRGVVVPAQETSKPEGYG